MLHNICVLRGDELDVGDGDDDDSDDGDDDDESAPPPHLRGCSCGSTSPCSKHCKSIGSIPLILPSLRPKL